MRPGQNRTPLGHVTITILLLVISVQAGCGGSNVAGDPLDMMLDNTVLAISYDMDAIRAGESISEFEDRLEDDWDEKIGAMGILADETVTLLTGFVGEGGQYMVLTGQFDFEFVRDDLDDLGYDEGQYRDYEIWTGGQLRDISTVALLEDRDTVLTGNGELVEDILRDLSRDSGDRDELDLARAMRRAGDGWLVFGFPDCSTELRGCRAFGGATSAGQRYEIVSTNVFMFRNERTAEARREDVEELPDPSDQVTVTSVTVEDEFVIAIGTLDEDDFWNALSFPSEMIGW